MASLPFSWLVVEEEQVESGVDPVDSSIMPSLGEFMLVVAHFFRFSLVPAPCVMAVTQDHFYSINAIQDHGISCNTE